MPLTTQAWLRAEIKTLPSVRACHPSLDSDADLVVKTWVGTSIRVYFLNSPPNLRALKRALQENTRHYQGSLFVAHYGLMPNDHTRLIPPDWMQALHELNSERIYAFIPGQAALQQVHFDVMPDGVEREAWHGEPVAVQQLRVLNVSATTRTIRGNWMVADFGPNPYWRASEARSQRMRKRFRGGAQQFVWGRPDLGGTPGGADQETLRRIGRSRLEVSYNVLGLDITASRDDVKAAYRQLARESHPDTSDMDPEAASARFREVSDAYAFIKAQHNWH